MELILVGLFLSKGLVSLDLNDDADIVGRIRRGRQRDLP